MEHLLSALNYQEHKCDLKVVGLVLELVEESSLGTEWVMSGGEIRLSVIRLR